VREVPIRRLTVLYDAKCGVCTRAQSWLANQPKFVELTFVPAASQEARCRYPELNHEMTLTELMVISDRGAVYWGAKAWLICLWALREYRAWSLRLATPELLPTARKVVSTISQHRYQLDGLSRAL
jgi:predicted DCC family thiol-disulfide oxidoreductase YuxK